MRAELMPTDYADIIPGLVPKIRRRPRTANSRLAHRSHVIAEELEDLRLVRVDDEEPEKTEESDEPQKRRAEDVQRLLAHHGHREEDRGVDHHDQQQQEHEEPRAAAFLDLTNHLDILPGLDVKMISL